MQQILNRHSLHDRDRSDFGSPQKCNNVKQLFYIDSPDTIHLEDINAVKGYQNLQFLLIHGSDICGSPLYRGHLHSTDIMDVVICKSVYAKSYYGLAGFDGTFATVYAEQIDEQYQKLELNEKMKGRQVRPLTFSIFRKTLDMIVGFEDGERHRLLENFCYRHKLDFQTQLLQYNEKEVEFGNVLTYSKTRKRVIKIVLKRNALDITYKMQLTYSPPMSCFEGTLTTFKQVFKSFNEDYNIHKFLSVYPFIDKLGLKLIRNVLKTPANIQDKARLAERIFAADSVQEPQMSQALKDDVINQAVWRALVQKIVQERQANDPSFTGTCTVMLANGQTKNVSQLQKGDVLASGAKVVCVVITKRSKCMLCTSASGLQITPRHPIKKDGRWCFPCCLYPIHELEVGELYDLVLDSVHTIAINGVEVAAFGHGLTEDNARHDYFGSQRVINDLKKLKGYESGRVHVKEWLREGQVGECGWMGEGRGKGIICGLVGEDEV